MSTDNNDHTQTFGQDANQLAQNYYLRPNPEITRLYSRLSPEPGCTTLVSHLRGDYHLTTI